MKVEHNQALIKPVSALCPMRCSYCFYHDLACERSIYAHPKMSLETLDLIFDTYTNNALYSTTFLFQGGEPLLAQDKFYAHYLQKVRKLKAKRPNFEYQYLISFDSRDILNLTSSVYYPVKILEILDIYDLLKYKHDISFTPITTYDEIINYMYDNFLKDEVKIDYVLFSMFKNYLLEIKKME